ncbi:MULTISPECIES: glycogen synthase GlgA [Halomonadaceae]|uniref:Glycogen synthase n=2 Tax=Vreelandella TaxID=3137766 RepID=A0A7Z0LUY5_9GAMM|nr:MULTISPECIES: glycogen synthase GlgA [Halomonas]AJY49691.1 Glycogen synthase [Halomonas sp. KO116]NYS79086.1 glycogen synthase GlgA [Halomonas glaciei]|tara:strand:- start:472 stop:2145 length:1674 start_codon:yes stop_codon:yes gene_type:complete
MGDVALSEVANVKSMSDESMVENDEKEGPRLKDAPFTDNQVIPRHHLNQTVTDRRYDIIDRRHNDKLDSPQRILFVTTEITDFVKVGGLGDVSSALPRALAAHHDVRVLIPAYREMVQSDYDIVTVGHLPAFAGLPACDIGQLTCRDGLIVYVLLCPELYEREGTPYGTGSSGYGDGQDIGWNDNDIRFARLSRAAADIALGKANLDWQPQLLHLNDWACGLAPAYVHWQGHSIPTIFTIHNLAYQGVFDASRLALLGIPYDAFNIHGVEYYGDLSFMKAGIVYASQVTTVSATYAQEITTPKFGCGLDGLLRCKAEQGRLSGIPNGIDDSWDPRTDSHLIQAFSSNDWRGKRANADYVRRHFGLTPSQGPLFAVISRMVHQKGLDLTIEAAKAIVHAGGQIVFMGCGEHHVEEALRKLAIRFPGAITAYIGFDEYQARCLFAGSDFLLMPSRFEPCGLSQMYAQRFGSLPIAHRTGGLADTIEDGVTGFLFDDMQFGSYMHAIQRAFAVYKSTDLFNAMRGAAMTGRYHWKQSIVPYSKLYLQALEQAGNEAALAQ